MNTPQEIAKPKLKFWWIMMGISTVISIFLNIWHSQTIKVAPELIADACAVSADLCERAAELGNQVVGIHPLLGTIFALVPPGFAAMLSHGLISELVGTWIKRGILALFGVSIATSVVSQASVMRPYGGGWAEWTIPLVLDSAALISLHIITITLADHRRKINAAEVETERISAKAEIRAALVGEVRSELEGEVRSELRCELTPGIRYELEGELRGELRCELTPGIRGEVERELRGEHAREIAVAVKIAQDELRCELEGEADERVRRAEVETAARVRTEQAGLSKAKPAAKKPPARTVASSSDDELSSEDRARMLLDSNPGITGGELGLALGASKRYGQILLAKIKGEEPHPDVVPLRAVND